MQKLQCLSCDGVYSPLGADGMRYFHVCPDWTDAQVKEKLGIVADDDKLTDAERARIAAFPRTREDARNENIDTAKVAASVDREHKRLPNVKDDDLVKAPGKGVKVLVVA